MSDAKQAKDMLKRQQVLADFGEFALGSDNLDEVLHEACRLVADVLGTGRSKVLEIQENGKYFFVRAGVGWGANVVGHVRLPMSEHSSESYSLDAGRPVITQNIYTEERFKVPEFMKQAGVMALANAPIYLPGRKPYGLLQVDATEPRDFGDGDTEFLRTYTTILGPVIDRLHKVHELRSSEERFEALVTASSDMVYRMSPDWSEMLELQGRSFLADTLDPSTTWLDAYIDPADQPLVTAAFERAIRSKSPFELEHRVRRANGSLGWVQSRAVPLLDACSEIREWFGAASDVTARKETEVTLRESEGLLAADLANAILLRDLAERLVTEENVATIYEEILSAAMSVMQSDAGTVQIYDPKPRALVLLVTRNFERTMTDHFRYVDAGSRTACGLALRMNKRTFIDFDDDDTDEACIMHVDAGYRSAQATPLVSRAGIPLGMLNTHWRAAKHRPNERQLHFLDLLARQAADLIDQRQAQKILRESQERLQQFGEASSDVLWIRDDDTLQWVYLTPAFEEIYGLSREAALADDNMRGWLDLILPEDRQMVLDSLQQVSAGKRISFEYRIRRPTDGVVRWLRDTDFPMRDEVGQIRWLGGIGRDITGEKEASVRQEVLVNELQHRARNLLGVITAVADRTVKQGGSVEAFEERLQALSRAQGLLSKSGSDTVEVGTLVRTELAAHMPAPATNVQILGPEVCLTTRQVQNFTLAVHELTTNAVKYGALKAGSGRLSVTWEVILNGRGRRRLVLSWVESGVTIEPSKVTRRGYGTELIQEALAYALEADVDYVLGEDGVRCRIEMPLS